ncbi:hypothetical protein TWF694_003814 [Orbilia ellipsospora]|uniref:Uncharacterized protein n=1 Tax=Orbilia ellipsospora TaxID=2528407 RepID=A0AAV9WZ90_9PEZI
MYSFETHGSNQDPLRFGIYFDDETLRRAPTRVEIIYFPHLSIEKASTIPAGGSASLLQLQTNYLQACSDFHYGVIDATNLQNTATPGPAFLLQDPSSQVKSISLNGICLACSIKIPADSGIFSGKLHIVLPLGCTIRLTGQKKTNPGAPPRTISTDITFEADSLEGQIEALQRGLKLKATPMKRVELADFDEITQVTIVVHALELPADSVISNLFSSGDDIATFASVHIDDLLLQDS